MGLVRCSSALLWVLVSLLPVLGSVPGFAWDNMGGAYVQRAPYCALGVPGGFDLRPGGVFNAGPVPPYYSPLSNYEIKLAYGKTFGTLTDLDYATLEVSKRISRYPALTFCGPAMAEVQFAMLASYVFYSEGNVERLNRLDFRDGFEIGWVPKGKFTFPTGALGMSPYLESGAGMSYVSETYRNSGSRWNWSFIGGFGLETCLPGQGRVSLGVQWRHMCNGNMWGEGDELHDSNSGTDMIQGLATILQPF